jgi:hypothetical protein
MIGRRSANGLTLADAEVSRLHARIERTPAGFILSDQQSMNGTRLNGRRIRVPHRRGMGTIASGGRGSAGRRIASGRAAALRPAWRCSPCSTSSCSPIVAAWRGLRRLPRGRSAGVTEVIDPGRAHLGRGGVSA